ncbi:unnamed protein product [Adineta ricciae]|uniref:Uncharacterized protein n=1 Tax=Adineta ricciae TaxID=249248 RepID=A0A813QKI0_ADIRI|nr:unnamed protein product [Adineta ricciae]
MKKIEHEWLFAILIFTPLIFAAYFFFYGRVWSLKSSYNVVPTSRYSSKEIYLGATQHWIRSVNNQSINPHLLVLVLNKDKYSWGQDERNSSFRTFWSFISTIKSSRFPSSKMSLGLLTSSTEEYHKYRKILEVLSTDDEELFVRVHLIYHPGYGDQTHDINLDIDRQEHHEETVQKERRRLLARLRNYLMLSSLRSEDHIIWLDADVYFSSDQLLQMLIEKSADSKQTQDLPVGLLTVRCALQRDPHSNYDLNAWSGSRQAPTAKQLELIRKGGSFTGRPTKDTKMLDTLLKGTSNETIIKLDSVGGTILYIKADLVRQGLVFPPYYVVGTEWNMSEGWDGIETEGLCYIAKNLGYGCYALGGDWVVTHTNY